MMNDFNLPEIRDLTAVPSDDLNRHTLAAMRTAERQKSPKNISLKKRILVCAAIVCAALALTGAGVRIYRHLTVAFVPGMGIVTVDEPTTPEMEVFTLAHVVETDSYRIEAVSMIPAEDEEHAGMWEVTVLTDQGPSDSSITLYGKDDVPYTLSPAEDQFPIHTPDTTLGARYSGYIVLDPASETDEYRLNWKNTDCVLPLKSLKDSVWATCSYPVSDGITAVVFPLAEGSRYLVFDVIFEPQSENMAYWFSHCYTSFYTAKGVSVTDTLGNTLEVSAQAKRAITVSETGQEYGINSLIHYRMENILVLDAPLTADIAEIVIDSIEVQFQVHEDVGGYLVKIPEPSEAMPAEELPDGGVFFDQHGIRITFDEITTRIDQNNNTYEIVFRRGTPIESDFEENVTDITIFPSYYEPDKSSDRTNIYTGSSFSEKNPETGIRVWNYTVPFHGAGDRKKIGLPLTFGDEVLMFINNLRLTITGDWHIDFTAD